jgi:hypothetical protein
MGRGEVLRAAAGECAGGGTALFRRGSIPGTPFAALPLALPDWKIAPRPHSPSGNSREGYQPIRKETLT